MKEFGEPVPILVKGNKMIEYLTKDEIIYALNRWMEEYTNNPDDFEETHVTAMKFLKEKLEGKEPSYGEQCYVILTNYSNEERS